MNTKPNDNWYWYFDPQYDRLMIDMGEQMLFRSRYAQKSLTMEAFDNISFSVEDASDYFFYEEKCHEFELTQEQRIELTLNALAAKRFLKPMMPKSWYFDYQSKLLVQPPQLGDCMQVTLAHARTQANLLVVEVGEIASLCLVAQPKMSLSDKTLQLGDAIKVMHDRLLIVQNNNLFYQQVG